MGATSVTGTGHGDVSGLNRGSAHMTLAVGNLLGPKVVVAGYHTLTSGSNVLNIGTLEGDLADYMVLVSDDGAIGVAAAAGQLTALNQVTIQGTSTHVIHWAVIHVGDNPVAGHAGSTV